MRIGKNKKKSKFWPKAGSKSKPKHVSPEIVIGQVSPNIIQTVLAPKLRGLATESLEQYAAELLNYQDEVDAFQEEYKKSKQLNDTSDTNADTDDTDDNNNNGDEEEIEVDMNGNIVFGEKEEILPLPPIPRPRRPVFSSQHVVDELGEVFTEASDHFMAAKGGWKVHANAAKFERMLDEKYGIFRPFITNHPEIEQFVRSVQRKYAMGSFSPFRQSKPPISRTTSVILLFMMQRGNVRLDALLLIALFLLVGLQPWALVTIAALVHTIINRRKRRPVGTMKRRIPQVEPYYNRQTTTTTDKNNRDGDDEDDEDDEQERFNFLKQPVGEPLKDTIDASLYDTLIIGEGADALYTGALLSRSGRKVLLLCAGQDASSCVVMGQGFPSATCSSKNQNEVKKRYGSIPFDVSSSNVARVSKQQQMLSPALCTTTDCQGGVRFAQVGSEADGHAFSILSIPGMGSSNDGAVGGGAGDIPFVLRAAGGTHGLMDDAAAFLGDGWPGNNHGEIGSSTSGQYLAACASINAAASRFYMSKILPEKANNLTGSASNAYQESSIRLASSLLDKCFPLNAHLRSLMAGIGMCEENIKPSMTSIGPHVTNISGAMSGEGMHYPVGGPRALCHAMASVIEQCGGRVVTNVKCKEFLFAPETEETKKKQTKKQQQGAEDGAETDLLPAPRCIGVKLWNGSEIRLPYNNSNNTSSSSPSSTPAVVSMVGFIDTFIRLFPENIRIKHKVPRGLPALSERRSVMKVIYLIKGTASELSVTGADYYRLPGAALAFDEIDPTTGAIKLGEIGWPSDDSNDDSMMEDVVNNNNNTSSSSRGKRTKVDSSSATTATTTSTTTIDATTTIPSLTRKKKSGKNKFETGKSWIHISFPSAKDPSFESCHGKITTCVVSVEADDDFVKEFETKPKLFVPMKQLDAGCCQRLMDRVRRDLLELYPQLEGNIQHEELLGPFGKGLSHNPQRYAAKGVRADTPYPGLFLGGSDLTVDSFSGSIVGGWLAANKVMGYNAVDILFLKKDITSDLEQFLDPPEEYEGEEDVAVPLPPSVENNNQEEEGMKKEEKDDDSGEETTMAAAEPQ